MRKRLINQPQADDAPADESWLDLESMAEVEITSEAALYPIESALLPGEGAGWQAAQPGEQTIRIRFDRPQSLRRIRLLFAEPETARTQEFTLRWSPDGQSFKEIVRQQYTFSPPATMQEVEDYRVELPGVAILELQITPDISGGEAKASLAQLRLA